MPIVKTDSMYFDGPFKRVVKFTKKDGFTCELPPAAFPLLGKTQTVADTLEGCLKLWDDAIKKWKAATTTTREVLLYKLQRQAHIVELEPDLDEEGQRQVARCVFSADDFYFNKGCCLAVCAGVFTETAVKLGNDTRYTYTLIHNRLPASIEHKAGGHDGLPQGRGEFEKSAIPTTPELEAFFTSVGLGMEKLIMMFEQLQKPEKVLELAASGFKMLGSGS